MAQITRLVGADIDPPAIGAGAAADVDINVAGLNLGQLVAVHPPPALEAALVPMGANVVDIGAGALRIRLRLYNPSAAAVDGAARRWVFGLVQEGE